MRGTLVCPGLKDPLDSGQIEPVYDVHHEVHEVILDSLSPESLARLLTDELGRGVWKGGDTSLERPLDVFDALAPQSWATLLGAGRLGHWVVVDGRDRHGRVLVRDPEGLRSVWPMRAFLEA